MKQARSGVGDVEIADEALDHTPVADAGAACICLAATDAPLRFRSFLPRLLQPAVPHIADRRVFGIETTGIPVDSFFYNVLGHEFSINL